MKTKHEKIVEILWELGVKATAAIHHKISENLWRETLERTAEEIALLYSAGEEVSDEKINDKANELYLYAFDGDVFDGTEIKIQGAWVKGAKWMRSKLTRPTVSEEEAGYNEMSKIVDVLVEHISPTEEELNVTSNEGWPKYNERILKIATEIKELN